MSREERDSPIVFDANFTSPARERIVDIAPCDGLRNLYNLSMLLFNTTEHTHEHIHYVGFWPRAASKLIDTCALIFIFAMLSFAFKGLIYEIVNASITLSYYFISWRFYGATFGMIVLHQRIFDTSLQPLTSEAVARRLGVAVLCDLLFGLPYISAAFDSRKQGVHDKTTDTVVVQV
jgi:uncharacterized RDD family membrane protein YckC